MLHIKSLCNFAEAYARDAKGHAVVAFVVDARDADRRVGGKDFEFRARFFGREKDAIDRAFAVVQNECPVWFCYLDLAVGGRDFFLVFLFG